MPGFGNLLLLGIRDQVETLSMAPFDFRSVLQAVNKVETSGLLMGDLDIQRYWGWAPEYVVAMWKMLQQGNPADFVVAAGATHSLREFVQEAAISSV